MPERIQLRRTKGWRKPKGVVTVARPTKWGNPFIFRHQMGGLVRYQPKAPDDWDFESRISADGMRHDYYHPDGTITLFMVRWATREEVVEMYRRTLLDPDEGMIGAHPTVKGHLAKVTPDDIRAELKGRDLACWCKPEWPCHADVLLQIANGPEHWCENCQTDDHDTASTLCPYLPPEVRARWKQGMDELHNSFRRTYD